MLVGLPASGKDEMITCRGIELGDGNYSGCDTRNHTLTDCPTCHGSGIETPHLIDLLKRFEQGCRLDRDDTFADLLMQARMTIEGLVADSKPNPQVSVPTPGGNHEQN